MTKAKSKVAVATPIHSDLSNQKINATLDAINAKYGKGSIATREGLKDFGEVKRLLLDHLDFDDLMGGGLPFGRVIELIGDPSSGKSSLALTCCAASQRVGLRAAFIDVEHALDVGYAAELEVNTDELLVSQPSSAEEALEICEMLVRSEEVGVIVLDSVAMLTTKAELDGEMGDAHVASLARLMGKALKKINAAVQKSNCIVIFINQYRMNIGPMASKTTPGGRTLPHVASIRMELRKKEVIEKIVSGDKVPIGQIVAINMKKNKVGIPYRKGEVTLLFPIEGQKAGFSKVAAIVSRAVEKSIIKKSGSWYNFDDQKLGQGEQKTYAYLEENPQILNSIKERL